MTGYVPDLLYQTTLNDWLCTRSPIPNNINKFQGRKITTTVEFDEKFNGTSHNLYFDDDDVIKTLLE